MNQASIKKLSMGKRIVSFLRKTWIGFAVPFWNIWRWIWLTIILVIVTGTLAGILIQSPKDFYAGIFLVALHWLFSPAFYQRLIVWIIVVTMLLTLFSAITAFFINRAKKALGDPLLKSIETVPDQLGKIVENSEKQNLEFGKYQQVIQDLTQKQIPQIVMLHQKDITLKEGDITRQQELDAHLKDLTAEIVLLKQGDITRQQELSKHIQSLTAEIILLKEGDLTRQQELDTHLKNLVAETKKQTSIVEQYIQQQLTTQQLKSI